MPKKFGLTVNYRVHISKGDLCEWLAYKQKLANFLQQRWWVVNACTKYKVELCDKELHLVALSKMCILTVRLELPHMKSKILPKWFCKNDTYNLWQIKLPLTEFWKITEDNKTRKRICRH